jgi:hypothetical protein
VATLKPAVISWGTVPDVRSPWFAGEAHRHSAAVASAEYAEEDQAFIDALAQDDG